MDEKEKCCSPYGDKVIIPGGEVAITRASAGADVGTSENVTEMQFLKKEEERFMGYLEMHERSARNLREEISAIRKIMELLQGQSNDMDCPTN